MLLLLNIKLQLRLNTSFVCRNWKFCLLRKVIYSGNNT